jgi:uncharacterized protein (DUF2249 family)
MQELDVRTLTPSRRHAMIFEQLEQLAVGGTLRVVVDHDPRPLRYELEDRSPGAFAWKYVECGPERWSVDVSKQNEPSPRLAMDLIADCQALQVAIVRLDGGSARRFEPRKASMALIVHSGKGAIAISGSQRDVTDGGVEILCPGESCTISAVTALQIYVVLTKA